MSDEQDTPKIHIDSDWKEEAQREKERLTEEESSDPTAGGERSALGQPTFSQLINMLAMQAAVALGGMRAPTGETIQPDPELARYHIDTLAVLAEKTQGNLTEEEGKMLVGVLHELRSAWVAMVQAAVQTPPEQTPNKGV